jgi:sugar lactone lactonase YvrE
VVYLALGGDAQAATNAYSFTSAELLGESPSRLHGLHFSPDAALVLAQDASGTAAQSFGVVANTQWALGLAAQSGANPSNTWRKLSDQGAIELLNPTTGARNFAASLSMSRSGMSLSSLNNITFGSLGSGNTQFKAPEQVAFDASGNLYIADPGNNRVKKHDAAGAFLSAITADNDSALLSPTGVAIDNLGLVYLVDGQGIEQYLASHTYDSNLVEFGGTASGPRHLAISGPDGGGIVTLAHTRFSDNRVWWRTFGSNASGFTGVIGSGTWGTTGSGNKQFTNPIGVCCDGSHVYVVDSGNHRIQKLTTSGVYVTKWGSYGSGPGEFSNPRGIAVDTNGDLWVADYGNQRLQKFSNTGTWLQTVSLDGNPAGVAASSGRLAVSFPDRNQIAVMTLPSSGVDLRVLYLGNVIATAGIASKNTGAAPAAQNIATGIRPKAALFATHADTQLNAATASLHLDAHTQGMVLRHRRIAAAHEAAHAVAVLVHGWDPVMVAMAIGEREDGVITLATDAGDDVVTDLDQLPDVLGWAINGTPICPGPGPAREAWSRAAGTIAWVGILAGNRVAQEHGCLPWPEDLPLTHGDGALFERALAATALSRNEFEHACKEDAQRILQDYEAPWRAITGALLERRLLRWSEVAALATGKPIEDAPAYIPSDIAPYVAVDEAALLQRNSVPRSLWRPEHLTTHLCHRPEAA